MSRRCCVSPTPISAKRISRSTLPEVAPAIAAGLAAKMAAALDNVSGGRFLFGARLGGEDANEFAACAVPVRQEVRAARLRRVIATAVEARRPARRVEVGDGRGHRGCLSAGLSDLRTERGYLGLDYGTSCFRAPPHVNAVGVLMLSSGSVVPGNDSSGVTAVLGRRGTPCRLPLAGAIHLRRTAWHDALEDWVKSAKDGKDPARPSTPIPRVGGRIGAQVSTYGRAPYVVAGSGRLRARRSGAARTVDVLLVSKVRETARSDGLHSGPVARSVGLGNVDPAGSFTRAFAHRVAVSLAQQKGNMHHASRRVPR
jgi:hypothetical protein